MEPRARSDNSTNTVLIILGVVFGSLLLMVAACAGIAYLTTYSFFKTVEKTGEAFKESVDQMNAGREAELAAEAFLTDLTANQTDRAYRETTRAYQAQHPPKDFQAEVAKHPVLKNVTFTQLAVPLPATVNERVSVRLMLNNNRTTVATFDMAREDGQWKVDEMTLP
jgi:hypothetical protein